MADTPNAARATGGVEIMRAIACVLAFAGFTSAFAQTAGTAVEYYHAGFGHFFVTAFSEEIASLDGNPASGWARTGSGFRVETAPGTGLSPVCRFFSAAFAPKSSHFYTPYEAECETVKGNTTWTYEATAFYLRLPDAAGACTAGTNVLYRLYNNGMTGAPNHRYTSSREVFDAFKAKGWVPEGDGTTGAFACTPKAATTVGGTTTGEVALQPGVLVLSAVQQAELLAVTADTVTFASHVGIRAGEIFVIDNVGAFYATAVNTSGGHLVVAVVEPTVDELFAKLNLHGTVALEAGEWTEGPGPQLKSGNEAALKPKSVAVVSSVYKGAPGIRIDLKYEIPCAGGRAKMELITASFGFYGVPKFSQNMELTKMEMGYFVPKVQVNVGCKLSKTLPRYYRLGRWSVPLPLPALQILPRNLQPLRFDIPLLLRFNAETDIEPVITLGLGEAEVIYLPDAVPKVSATVNGNLTGIEALVAVLAPSATYSAKVGIEVDGSLRLKLFGSYHLGSLGVVTGPAVELKAVLGLKNELCATLLMPTKVYLEDRSGRSVSKRDVFQKDFEVGRIAGICTTSPPPPTGTWILTRTSCQDTPAGCGLCQAATLRETLVEATGGATIAASFPDYPGIPGFTLALEPPSQNYSGCSVSSSAVVCQVAVFDLPLKRTATIGMAEVFSGSNCTITTSWQGALQ